jgi:hypothetical protein
MHTSRLTPVDYQFGRNRYVYPAVGLRTLTSGRVFVSVRAMERTVGRLLKSADDDNVQLGYLNVVYWGHYLGKGGRPNPNRALAKVGSATTVLAARGIAPAHVALCIRCAAAYLRAHCSGYALRELAHLPELGPAFASKVCAFLDLHRHGVVDSVIVGKYPEFGFPLTTEGYVKACSATYNAYRRYCRFLARKAAALNSMGPGLRWREAGRPCRWRAVDVERALYVLAMQAA